MGESGVMPFHIVLYRKGRLCKTQTIWSSLAGDEVAATFLL